MADPILGPVLNGDTFKAILFQRLYGQEIMNVLHYQCSEVPTVNVDRFEACRQLSNKLITGPTGLWFQMRAMQSQDLKYIASRVQVLIEHDQTYPFFQEPVTGEGARAVPAALSNVALSIEKRANFPPANPRRGIGRIQIAGIPNDTYEGGIFDPAYLADWANFAQDLTDPITFATDGTLRPVLVHKGANLWLDNPIFGTVVHDTVRVMNRRTVGRGI